MMLLLGSDSYALCTMCDAQYSVCHTLEEPCVNFVICLDVTSG